MDGQPREALVSEMKTATGTETENVLCSLLHAARALEDALQCALEDVGLSGEQFDVLSELASADEPLALRALAARVAWDPSHVTLLVDQLAADGSVRRVPDSADGGDVGRAAITSLGRKRHSAAVERVGAVHRRVADAMGGVDRASVERALAALK